MQALWDAEFRERVTGVSDVHACVDLLEGVARFVREVRAGVALPACLLH